MPTEDDKKSDLFLWVIGISCFFVIFSAFYFFYYEKYYNFIVEVSCDPLKETCFERDCSNPDDCPPNGLSDFKRYTLNAGDFKMCVNEDCTTACETGIIKCEPIKCAEDEAMGETCSVMPVNES